MRGAIRSSVLVVCAAAAVLPLVVGLALAAPAVAQGNGGTAVTGFGDATAYGSPPGSVLAARLVGITATRDAKGYWLVGADGGVFSYGDAGFYGSQAGYDMFGPYVGLASTPDGKGYWLADDLGRVYNFGDAVAEPFEARLWAPAVGIASNPLAMGYWLVAADGGVFSFGDARFYGSLGGVRLNEPVVGMASTPDGGGYWLVAADGGVFSFGDARFYGSMGASPPSGLTPVVAMAATSTGRGYWLATSDKQVPPPGPVPAVMAECTMAGYPPPVGPAPSVEPTSIVLACGDGNASLTDLTWTSWTYTTAAGFGYFTHNTCTPDCAGGTFVSTPANVRLAYPIRTGAGLEFATIAYSYADPAVPGGRFAAERVIPTNSG